MILKQLFDIIRIFPKLKKTPIDYYFKGILNFRTS